MQVANDVASANELPSREGRRVNNSASGKLQGGEVREDCAEGALERGLAGGERGVRGVRGQQRRVGLGALERRDAGIPASKLRCDEGLGGETQQCICYLGVHLQWCVQPVHCGEQGGQRAGVCLADEGGVQGCRGDCVQEGGCDLRVHLRRSVDGRLQGVRGQGAGVCLGGLQSRDGGVSTCELGGQRCGGDDAQESVGHLGVDLQRRDPCCDVEGVLVHHRLEAVVGGHRGQRGVVGRGDGAVHGCHGAVVRQHQVHAVGGALRGHHALQHVEARLVGLVRETRGQRTLQRRDVLCSHLPVRGGQGCCRASALLSSFEASSAVTRSSRDWMAAALLPDAAVFTARSATCA